ncbi:glutathione synthase [bacterium]|nr:glutathione synthase [bacterium]
MMKEIILEAVDYCFTNGIVKYNSQFVLTHAPICLSPFQIPEEVLDSIVALTPVYNELMVKVGNNRDFLQEHLKAVAKTDLFIKKLLDLLSETDTSHHLQISRNDFLLTDDNNSGLLIPKQVEFNTISNSFPYLSGKVYQLHQYMVKRLHCQGKLVKNDPLEGVVDAMGEVVTYYDVPNTYLLMVVQSQEQNLFDQRGIEYRLLDKYGIQTIRMTLEEVAEHGCIRKGHLVVNNRVIALTYFRAAYTPNDYTTNEAWNGRILIEKSSTIKCPSVGMQLAGAKKIQQVLAKPGIIEQFLPAELAREIRKNFAAIYELDEKVNSQTAFDLAMQSPHDYVLKPQREGGGNNLYGEEMVAALKGFNNAEKQAYILMERIKPPGETSILVVDKTAEEVKTVSEIGRYATCFYDGSIINFNRDIGYLVRTKSANQNEGGVCAGYACLNSQCVR